MSCPGGTDRRGSTVCSGSWAGRAATCLQIDRTSVRVGLQTSWRVVTGSQRWRVAERRLRTSSWMNSPMSREKMGRRSSFGRSRRFIASVLRESVRGGRDIRRGFQGDKGWIDMGSSLWSYVLSSRYSDLCCRGRVYPTSRAKGTHLYRVRAGYIRGQFKCDSPVLELHRGNVAPIIARSPRVGTSNQIKQVHYGYHSLAQPRYRLLPIALYAPLSYLVALGTPVRRIVPTALKLTPTRVLTLDFRYIKPIFTLRQNEIYRAVCGL